VREGWGRGWAGLQSEQPRQVSLVLRLGCAWLPRVTTMRLLLQRTNRRSWALQLRAQSS